MLEGSVRKAGNRLRVNVRMARTRDARQLWSERFDGSLDDVFAVEDRISDTVLKKLQLTYDSAGEHSRQPPAPNLEVYELYLRARHSMNQRSEASLKSAIDYFRQALELESDYAVALAGLADAYVLLGVYGAMPPEQVMPQAREAAEGALALDPACAEALVSRGSVRSLYDWEHSAQDDFKRALEINPGYAIAHHWYANNYLLPRCRFGTARHALNQARRLDPLAPAIRLSWGLLAYLEGRYAEAAHDYSRILETDPGFAIARYFRGLAYLEQEAGKDAVLELEAAVQQCGSSSESVAAWAVAHARAGDRGEARRLRGELEERSRERYVSPVLLSQIEIALGRLDAALDRLEEAAKIHATDLIWIRSKPTFAPLRSRPRFRELCEELGL